MNKKTLDYFLQRAKLAHGDTYDYSKVEYINSKIKVIIICKKHGDFLQTPAAHYVGQRCPICAKENQINLISHTNESFIKKANKVHYNKYDYSLIKYKNGLDKVTIICKKHGEFQQIAKLHLQGYGCPNCHRSRNEEYIEQLFLSNNIIFHKQKIFDDCIGLKNKLPFDFYIPSINLCIEFDGVQHFIPTFGTVRFKTTKRNDTIKTNYAKQNGICLLRISYKENVFDKLSVCLKQFNINLNPLSD